MPRHATATHGHWIYWQADHWPKLNTHSVALALAGGKIYERVPFAVWYPEISVPRAYVATKLSAMAVLQLLPALSCGLSTEAPCLKSEHENWLTTKCRCRELQYILKASCLQFVTQPSKSNIYFISYIHFFLLSCITLLRAAEYKHSPDASRRATVKCDFG